MLISSQAPKLWGRFNDQPKGVHFKRSGNGEHPYGMVIWSNLAGNCKQGFALVNSSRALLRIKLDTDSVVGDTGIVINEEEKTIEDFFDMVDSPIGFTENGTELKEVSGSLTPTVTDDMSLVERNVKYVMRHKVKKKLYRLTVGERSVTVTEDHSIIVEREGNLHDIAPTDLRKTDKIILLEGRTDRRAERATTKTNDFLVEEIGETYDYVYDLEVEETNRFFANEILVHNSIYLSIPPKVIDFLNDDEEEITNFADLVGEMTNETFPDFCLKAFNCPEERKNIIQTDREAVADKSLFLTKKRYIMHLVNDEGKKVDKYKSMGLEVKKSDTAPVLRRYLEELLHLILDGENSQTVHDRIKEMKKEYYTLPIKEIGTPKPTGGLKAGKETFRATKSMKGISYHIRAAMFYDQLCSTSDRPIMIGEKVYVCYIKHVDSKYIGVPVDMNNDPEWLLDIPIDYDMMWEKAEKKITNYLVSVGFDYKSEKEERVTNLFGM